MSKRTWSEQQVAIFGWFAAAVGNLVIRARAGTGKTTTILEAITHIVGDAKILVCAFNKRIQVEIQGKLTDPRAEAKTLHALGFAFIRRMWNNVKIDDQVEWDRIHSVEPSMPDAMGTLVKRLVSLAKGAAPFGDVAALEELAFAYDVEPENGWLEEGWTTTRIAEITREVMDLSKVRDKMGRISFDDMLFIPVANGFARAWFDWVIVDEAQDMNHSQLLLAQAACKKTGHIVVVGDDRQAIYGFRGADSGSIDRLKSELKAVELGLNITYRCPKSVVAIAAQIVPDYQAAPTAPEGTVMTIDVATLADHVQVNEAILSRTNAPLVSVCLGLIRKGVAARIEGRDIGKALATTARKMNAKSVPDFLKRLESWATKQAARATARGKGVEQKVQEITDQVATLGAMAEGCVNVSEIIDRCTRFFADTLNADGSVNKAPAVVCSSIHKAKGLEWEKVFILEDTLYCNGKRRGDREEANIHYVAVTRAKDTLVLAREAK